MPKFQGKGANYFRAYIGENVKFPREAQINGMSGTVYTTFVIDKDGTVTDVEILRGVHPVIDKAVLNAIENSPKWEPGLNNGRFVKVRFSLSIKFELL